MGNERLAQDDRWTARQTTPLTCFLQRAEGPQMTNLQQLGLSPAELLPPFIET